MTAPRLLSTFAFLGVLLQAWPGLAAPVRQPHSEAELIAEQAALVPGGRATLGLHLRLEPGWHVYWKYPGDSGMATSIAWTLPAGFSAGPLQWPYPIRIDTGPLTTYGYESEVVLLSELQVPAGLAHGAQVPISAQADWLVCKEICLPAGAQLTLTLPVAASPGTPNLRQLRAIRAARAALPVASSDWRASVERSAAGLLVHLRGPEGAPRLEALAFFPAREGLIANAQPQRFTHSATGYTLQLAPAGQATGAPEMLAGVLVARPGFRQTRAIEIDLAVQAAAAGSAAPQPPAPGLAAPPPANAGRPGAEPPTAGPGALPPEAAVLDVVRTGALAALLLAFAGGLLLNLMPCVFPVLAIKVLSVVQRTHGHSAQLRTHGMLFALGVLLAFWVIAGLLLGLRAQGEALGWGYQLQSPAIVAGLALLFFVLGLNLSGVFQIGRRTQSIAGGLRARGAHADALLSGMLATAVAAPCTAPFMGAALGYALVRPAAEAMLVFTALALGMALPYVVLCWVPQLTRRLPRPGPWMDSLKQLLAFPLYATVVWLVWVLGQQAGNDAVARLLAGLVLIAAGCWAIGRWSRASQTVRGAALAVALLAIAGGLALAWPGTHVDAPRREAHGAWQPWSEAAVDAARTQGRAVFVDFTAAWCITCQVNKRLVLNAEAVQRRFAELDVVRLRADWTRRDPAITAALARLDRSGVPVYALYPAGGGEPRLLPEVLTEGLVLDALAQAARGRAQASAATIQSDIKENP